MTPEPLHCDQGNDRVIISSDFGMIMLSIEAHSPLGFHPEEAIRESRVARSM